MIVAGIVESIVWFFMKYDLDPFIHESQIPDSTIGLATFASGVPTYFLVGAIAKSDRDEDGKKWTGEEIFAGFVVPIIAGWIPVVVMVICNILITG